MVENPIWRETSGRICSYGSWKENWLNHVAQQWPEICSVFNYTNTADRDLHIINNLDRREWIVPGCVSCNNRMDELSLKEAVNQVSANKSHTCEIKSLGLL